MSPVRESVVAALEPASHGVIGTKSTGVILQADSELPKLESLQEPTSSVLSSLMARWDKKAVNGLSTPLGPGSLDNDLLDRTVAELGVETVHQSGRAVSEHPDCLG